MTDQPVKPARSANVKGDTGFLHPGEQVTLRAQISPGIYWKALALFFVSLLLMIKVFNLGVFLLLVSFVMFLMARMTKHYLLLVLTDQRVIIRAGVLNLETIQFHYSKIESVEIAWSPVGRMLGYGTVFISGTGSRVIAVPFIANALEFRSTVDNLITRQEDKPMKVEVTNPGKAAT
jgi:membrane protein YdbS with pleckstrin-like domain